MAAGIYTCPLTLEPPDEPVTTPCGHTFERAALENYRRNCTRSTCPLCRTPMAYAYIPFFGLAVNTAMRDQMEQLRDQMARLNAAPPAADAPTLDVHDIIIDAGRPIGSGTFGRVRRATLNGARVAIKQTSVEDEGTARVALRELAVLQRLRYPHIVQLLGMADNVDAGELWLVLELAEHGSVASLLGADKGVERLAAFGDAAALPGETRVFYTLAHQVACALAFLHRQRPHPIVHGDVKGENVLVCAGGKAKLADFGLAKVAATMHARGSTTGGGAPGTARFMAPELFGGAPRSAQSDVYALGVLLSTLLTGARPFTHLEGDLAVMRAVCDGRERPSLPKATSDQLRGLIASCWAAAPNERLASADVQVLLMAAGGEAADAAAPAGGAPALAAARQPAVERAVQPPQPPPQSAVQPLALEPLEGMAWPALSGALLTSSQPGPQLNAERAAALLREAARRIDTVDTERDRAVSGGVLQKIVAVMQAHSQHAGVQEAACRALANITYGWDAQCDARRQQADDAGALGAVLAAMQAHSQHAGVQELACRALANITYGWDAEGGARKQRAADTGALGAAIAAMQAHSQHPGVQERACRALANITAGSDAEGGARRQRAADTGALGAAIAAMQAHSQHAGVQQQACLALAFITFGITYERDAAGSARKRMALAAGALPAVQRARQTFPEMDAAKFAADCLQ